MAVVWWGPVDIGTRNLEGWVVRNCELDHRQPVNHV